MWRKSWPSCVIGKGITYAKQLEHQILEIDMARAHMHGWVQQIFFKNPHYARLLIQKIYKKVSAFDRTSHIFLKVLLFSLTLMNF